MASIARKRARNFSVPWKQVVNAIVILSVISLFLFALTKLNNAKFFPIKDVKVYGVQHLNHDEVEALILPFISKGFFFVDVDRVKERLLQLPWVANVVVQRVWPSQVVVTVSEKVPFALWNDTSLLSQAGDLFTPEAQTYPKGLPQFAGPGGEQILMTQYYAKMSSLLMPLHFKIARLELTPTLAWIITLDNGMKLNAGHKDVLTRLSHFVKVYPKIVSAKAAELEYVDLRYTNGMAVRWKSIT